MLRNKSKTQDWIATESLDSSADLLGCVDLDEMGPLNVVGGFAQPQFALDLEHTPDHPNCPACPGANSALQAEKINYSSLPFKEFRKVWELLRHQSTSLKVRTHEADAQYLDQLEKFFGPIRMRDITPGHLRAYQIARTSNRIRIGGEEVQLWMNPCGHSIINHELSVVQRMLEHCRLWARIKPYYFPLKTPKWSPRQVLSDEDEQAFFKAAAANPDCGVAYWVAAITTNTSTSGIELRGLRLKHIFLRGADEISEIYISEDSVKNDSRPRKIPLNPVAKWAVGQCYKRALKLGSCEPDHYLFPFRNKRTNKYEPEQAPSRWEFRRSWDKLQTATGFREVKPHDFRFLFVTKELEAGVDPELVRDIAGHVSHRMV